ncbi:MAG: rRNA methyltransferase [Raineya sp.]|jgi:16S rRNA C967 or C1407 C5-methylase (RsmB/RsmF family)/NOL1/NOP2/fmu family ribosome biogenesis protein|nr:rRNA methyltransferase [Raineya sp.]
MENTLPSDFTKKLAHILPENEHSSFLDSLQDPPITSIRYNFQKNVQVHQEKQSPVKWCKQGFYLSERPSFTEDPTFWAGSYYVQEASSMFLGKVIEHILPKKDICVLDLSAAPGGKSTHLISLISSGSLLVANEIIKNRADILEENLIRWGNSNYLITQTDSQVWGNLENFFDIIVVDAPCSGEGMFRKEPQAITEWSLDNVNLCASRQKRILADVLPALKAGGFLVYSTCTYNTQENEENLSWLTKNQALKSISIPFEKEWGIRETQHENIFAYRFFPHLLQGEGFFIACLQKLGNSLSNSKTKKNIFTPLPKKQIDILKNWISIPEKYQFYTYKNQIFLIQEHHSQLISQIATTAYIKHTSLQVGELKQNDFIPSHDLAMTSLVNQNIQRLELDYEQAMKYLRKQDFTIDTNLKGWCLMQYKGLNLGWAKILPNRINNYYPVHQRVRKQ